MAIGRETIYRIQFVAAVFLFQLTFLLIYVFCVEYDNPATPLANHTRPENNNPQLSQYYPMFQDVHVMMFIGFGFLMTFLKKYGFSAVSINFLIAAMVLQWSTICGGFINREHSDEKVKVNVVMLLKSDFAAAAVLITFGAVLGKLSPLQYVVMSMIHIPIYHANEYLGLHVFQAVDVGGSIFVHAFGAYFGLAMARVLYTEEIDQQSSKQTSNYHSDIFSMIGTVFLWLFWPSFNSALAVGDARHRAVMNTYYSLAACCVTTFMISALTNKGNTAKMDMVHVQNSTLAGGVAVGTMADMMIDPWGAILIGMVAGTLSVVGFQYITPWMNWKLKIHDTCGVHNLHGMPAIMAAVGSSIAAAVATEAKYGSSLHHIFPARRPFGEGGLDRTASEQAGYQLAALACTIAISLVAGSVTGAFLKLPIWRMPKGQEIFDDSPFFEEPEVEVTPELLQKIVEALARQEGGAENAGHAGGDHEPLIP